MTYLGSAFWVRRVIVLDDLEECSHRPLIVVRRLAYKTHTLARFNTK